MALQQIGVGEDGITVYTYETGFESNPCTPQPVESGQSCYRQPKEQANSPSPKSTQGKIGALIAWLLRRK